MAKRGSKNRRRKRNRPRVEPGGDLPLNLLGVATYEEVARAFMELIAANGGTPPFDTPAFEAVCDELDRRHKPVPIRIRRPTKDDVGDEVYHRVRAQMRRWCEFYGYGYDPDNKDSWLGMSDGGLREEVILTLAKACHVTTTGDPGGAEIPVQIDPECGEFTEDPDAKVPPVPNAFFDPTGKGTFEIKDDQNMIEVPLRVLLRLEEHKPCIDYISTLAPREHVNRILDCEATDWTGSPPDRVILYPKGEHAHGPAVLACGHANEPFKSGGTIHGPLRIIDLTEDAEAYFLNYVLEVGNTGRVSRSEHQAIVGYNLILRQHVTQKTILGNVNLAWLWPQLRDAVIFEFPKAAFETLYESYRNHFMARTKKEAGKDPTREKVNKLFLELTSHGADIPLPDKVPFPACYFAVGAGIETELLGPSEAPGDGKTPKGVLLAVLLADNGDVVSFIAWLNKDADPNHPQMNGVDVGVFWSRKDGKWTSPEGMFPWIIPSLIEYVNDHKTLVEEGKRDFNYRRMIDRHAKKTRFRPPIPPPFYVVYLQDKVIEEHKQRTLKAARKIEWQHRWQCRGSWNIRVKRGPLPIDPKVEADLRARKYQLFAGIPQMPAELAVELHQRGIAPRGRDEWLAVLRYWRKPHTKGPEDKPLIESVRRSTKKWGGGSNGE